MVTKINADSPSKLFWLTVLLYGVGEMYGYAIVGPYHPAIFFLLIVICFVIPAAILWRRAASGFPILGWNSEKPTETNRARCFDFYGPMAVFFYFAYLAPRAETWELTILYGACAILTAISFEWLYFRIKRIEKTVRAELASSSCQSPSSADQESSAAGRASLDFHQP